MKSWRQAENILKMKIFHTAKCRAYPHERLNTSKWVIRRRKLPLPIAEEMTIVLGKQGVTNIRRISIRKDEKQIQTNSYNLTFNQLHTPKEVKIDYCLVRVEMYVPTLLRCFKCQMKACRGQQTCAKCSEKDLNHMAEDCLKEIRCSNCQQGHPAYARSCDIDKKKEILEVKPKTNVSFQKARKTVGSFMGENMLLLHGEWIQSTKKMNTELLWRKGSSWNQMIAQSFRITWKEKKNTWPNFSKHKLKKLKMKRNPMWDSLSNNTQNLPLKHKPLLLKVQNLIQSIHQKLSKTNNLSPQKMEQLEHNLLAPIDQNTDDHQSERWKTRKCIQTALRQIQYNPFNIKNKVTYKNE